MRKRWEIIGNYNTKNINKKKTPVTISTERHDREQIDNKCQVFKLDRERRVIRFWNKYSTISAKMLLLEKHRGCLVKHEFHLPKICNHASFILLTHF